MNRYLVLESEGNWMRVKRYANGPGEPHVGDSILHNTVLLAPVTGTITNPADNNNWVLNTDRELPYILPGTILSIGTQ